ncbi:MDR family MFS transporter [Flagellimonas beolgyonensis]|uniref:MDR family MFS transporter n=1 Tax=Flagellimonas beolgyonensis TaxID=864064 RepID=UPI003D64A37E
MQTVSLPNRFYPKGIQLFIIVVTAVSAAVLELIDVSIVNVAIRDISGSLGATTEEVSWVITAYAISNLIIIPLTGLLSSYFGRKNYFTYSIILFTAASFMCGLAENLPLLIFFRFVQGLGGGALLSTAQGIIFEAFPPEKANTGTAFFGMGIVIGPALGPTLGGYIVDNFSWEWIFFINVPIGLIATLLSIRYIKDQGEVKRPKTIDWMAIIFLAVGVGSLQYFLEEGNDKDWFSDKAILYTFMAALIGIGWFVWIELRRQRPTVDLKLVKRTPNLKVGMLLNFIVGLVLFGTVFTWPLLAQISLGWTATMTGESLMPGALITAVTLAFTGKMIERGIDPKYFIVTGFLVLFCFVSLMYFQSPDSTMKSTFFPLLIRGVGLGMLITPIITLSIQGLRGADLNQGTGLTNMTRQLGGAVGIALINLYINHRQSTHINDLSVDTNQGFEVVGQVYEGNVNLFLANGFDLGGAQAMALRSMEGSIQAQALLLSYLDSFAFVGLLCILAIPLAFLFRTPKGGVGKVKVLE